MKNIPRISTGYENIFGFYSHAYKQLDGEWEVIKKIQKFDNDCVYTLVMYNATTDTYDMIEKQTAVCLSEKFGYGYNTDFMDSLKVGDKVENDLIQKFSIIFFITSLCEIIPLLGYFVLKI